MYTLLFTCRLYDQKQDLFFNRLADVIKRTMPHIDAEEYTEKTHEIPEVQGGWYWRLPVVLYKRGLISEWWNDDIEVLSIGKASFLKCPLAESIGRLWRENGIEAVRSLEGSYSAIIVDKIHSKVYTATDLFSQQTLLYCSDGPALFISPHVLTLVATGRIKVDYDWISMASSISVDWSLQSRPLVKGISACRPWEYLQADSKGVSRIKNNQLEESFKERLDNRDIRRIKQLQSECIDHMYKRTCEWSRVPDDLMVDLTAGVDSRGSFALALAAKGASGIVAHTGGEEYSADRLIAHRIVSMVGCRAHTSSPSHRPQPCLDDFYRICDQRTFLQNGDSDARMALFASVDLQERAPRVIGNGGEVFRGYYYGKISSHVNHLGKSDLFRLIASKLACPLSPQLAWATDELIEGVQLRAQETIDELVSISAEVYDVLDLLYLFERLSRWGNITTRAPWNGHLESPYINAQLVRMAYRMPSPIGKYSQIQVGLIKKFLPRSYWLPINGRYYLPFEGPGILKKVFRRLALIQLRINRRIKNPYRNGLISRDHNAVRAAVLGHIVQGELKEIILAKNSISSTLFNRKNAANIVESSSNGDNYLGISMGHIVALERWHQMIQEASKLSSEL